MAAHPEARGDLRDNGSIECGERHAVAIRVNGARACHGPQSGPQKTAATGWGAAKTTGSKL